MRHLFHIELYKLVKRRDFLLLATMIIIPIFYGVGAATRSSIVTYEGTDKTYGLKYFVDMYSFIYMIFIYFFLLAMSSIRSLRGELENKSIRLYSQRINNRSKLYLSKNLAMITAFSLITTLFFIVSMLVYYLLVIKRTDIAELYLLRPKELGYLAANFLSIYLFFIWSILYSFMLGAYLKSSTALGIYVLTIVFGMYLKEFPYVKYLSPAYYTQSIMDTSIDAIKNILIMLFVIIFYCTLFFFVGRNKLEKSDI